LKTCFEGFLHSKIKQDAFCILGTSRRLVAEKAIFQNDKVKRK